LADVIPGTEIRAAEIPADATRVTVTLADVIPGTEIRAAENLADVTRAMGIPVDAIPGTEIPVDAIPAKENDISLGRSSDSAGTMMAT
ncbi:MAG: hypothetical protein AAFP90_22095, partial [Planctomycetota bacterium]